MSQFELRITLAEPFFAGSHREWALAWQQYSQHNINLLTLSGHHWKWRMHGGAITLAQQAQNCDPPDVFVTTDMLNLPLFMSLMRQKWANVPVVLYFHENQLTYPWSPTDVDVQLKRDNHYSFINYSSALAADYVWFNSDYHRRSFLGSLPAFLQQFPDYKGLEQIDNIVSKSHTMPLGVSLQRFDEYRPDAPKTATDKPLLLWNHRWEYDKNAEAFFAVLFALSEQGYAFELAVLGEQYTKQPAIFAQARQKLQHHIVYWGYAPQFADYAYWLWRADILPVTAIQDFFGQSVVEAMYCATYPLLPNRLAYPEHLPSESKQIYLYDTDSELYQKLCTILPRIEEVRRELAEIPAFVQRYDWQYAARQYDEALQQYLSS